MSASLRLARVLVAVAAGCSRQPTENPATPYLQAPAASFAVPAPRSAPDPSTLAASSASSPAPLRSIAIRHNRPAGDMPPAADLDLIPGTPPDAAHPFGTSYVVQLADDDAVHATEWDLSTRTQLHDTKLDLPASSLQLLGAGRSVRLMASEYNGRLFFVQLTRNLQVVTRQELGSVSVLGPNAFAGDESVAAILAHGTPDGLDGPLGIFVISFDAGGNRLGKRMLEPYDEDGGTLSPQMNDNLAVLDGHVYVILVDAAYRLRILRLTRDLRTERERRLPLPASFNNPQAKLLAVDGHLLLDLPESLDLLELPLDLDLSHLTHRPRPAPPPPFPGVGGATDERCGPSLRMASELLALCNCSKQTCLSWALLPP